MAQTNSEYWEQRIANNTWSVYNSLEEKNRTLLEMYQEASLNISEELYKVAEKINSGKGISLSDMHKFNRLKALKSNFETIMRKLGEDVEKFGKDNMKEGSKKVYENVMTELGQTDFTLPNERLMEEMMKKPWEGSSFSQRLWKNTQVLASNLNELLTIGLQQGKTTSEIAINLNNRMNKGFNVAHRLIRTETMHYLNESAAKAYEDGGCKEVQLWAAIDERTCPTCGIKHGNIYKTKDRPTLPLHVNCRCTYLPVILKDDANKDHDKAKQDVQNEWDRRRQETEANKKLKTYEARADEIFTVIKPIKGDSIKAKGLINELNKSDVGKEALNYIVNNNLKVEILYTDEVEEGLRGQTFGSNIEIFAVNTRTKQLTASTIIHEVTHIKYGIGGDQWAEAVCFSKELIHKKGILTVADKRNIIKKIKKLYPEYQWRKGK